MIVGGDVSVGRYRGGAAGEVTTWPTFSPSVLAATLKVLTPAVRVGPAAPVCAPTVLKSKVVAPEFVALAERVTVVPETLSTVVLAARTPVLPAAAVTDIPG